MVGNKRRKLEDDNLSVDILNEIAEQLADVIQGKPLKVQRCLEGIKRCCSTVPGYASHLGNACLALIRYIEIMRDAVARVINLIRNGDGGAQQSSRDEVLSTLRRVLAHSHRLSFTTSAPPGYNPGKSFLYLTKPPAPQPPQLQSSILHNIQRQYEAKRKRETETHVDYIPEATVDQKPSLKPAGESTKPLSIPKGIDGDLLKRLPPMPKGWKPGDPIPGLPNKQESKEEVKQTEQKPTPPAPFSFALNPDMDIEFGVGESEESDSDDSE